MKRCISVYLLPYTVGSLLVMVRRDGHWCQVAEAFGHLDSSVVDAKREHRPQV